MPPPQRGMRSDLTGQQATVGPRRGLIRALFTNRLGETTQALQSRSQKEVGSLRCTCRTTDFSEAKGPRVLLKLKFRVRRPMLPAARLLESLRRGFPPGNQLLSLPPIRCHFPQGTRQLVVHLLGQELVVGALQKIPRRLSPSGGELALGFAGTHRRFTLAQAPVGRAPTVAQRAARI